jgi:signal transduction histidine kinase/predicted ATPase
MQIEASHHLDELVRKTTASSANTLSGVLVSGYRGTGKTWLVENYLQAIESSHPVLIARHYPQHQNIPYFGFKYCVSDYLGKVYSQATKSELRAFSAKLKDFLGENIYLLLDYIPELSLILGEDPSQNKPSHLTIENQLYPLFRRIFEFLSEYNRCPVYFFTDDLQWIDASGINLLKYLLLNLSNKQLVWIGAHRTPHNKTSLLGQLLEELRLKDFRIEHVGLKGLNPAETAQFISMTLDAKASEEFVDTCYKITAGNPSHLQALLESLRNSDLIWNDGKEVQCNAEGVIATYQGQKTQTMLLEQVRRLSPAAYEVLCIAACMGRFDRQLILDWLGGDATTMKSLLDEALDAGLLKVYEQDIRFSDMHVGEMIYDQLSESHKLELHYKIANLFYARGVERLNRTDIIMMTTSFNQSLERVKADGRLMLTAELNYQAGKILEKDKAYDQARYFFKMSAEMLKECRWEDVKEQVWRVYMDRARIEYFLGDYDLAEIHLDYLLERIHNPLKRSKVFELKVTINNHLARYQKVVYILRESLAELGLALPVEENDLEREVARLKVILGKQEENPEPLADAVPPEYSEAILRLLYVGGMSLHHTSDVLMTWAAMQIILRANRENPSVVKAIGYVSYGRMQIIAGDIDKGYEFGTKGLALNKALDDITLRCRVFGVFAFYIQPWKKDFSESYPLLDEAADAGRKAGDLIGVYILKTHRLNLHIISGLPLKGLSQWDFEESYPGMELTYYITHYQKSLIRFLTGESTVFSIPRQNPSSLAGQLTIKEEKFYRNYVWARYYFLFGHYDLAARTAEEADANRKLQEASPLVPANLFTWFLAVSQGWNSYPRRVRERLAPRVEHVLQLFEVWQHHAPSNYRPAWLLIKAEWLRMHDHDDAATYYQASWEVSGDNIYHRAVTSELWARFLLNENPNDPFACSLLERAIEAYDAWNATAKTRQLRQQYAALLKKELSDSGSIDIETIQYELSGDMEVQSLVKKLMVLLLRISGSTRVTVELVEDARDRIAYDALSLFHESPLKQPPIPGTMVRMVLKSHNPVVVNELRAEKGLYDLDDIHARGVKSFLILPVTISGHVSMVVYLENVIKANWYTPERLKAVKITANQGAVMIENARIHEHSVRLNKNLRKEMAEKERLSSLIEAQQHAHMKALMQAQYTERKRMARDLHDGLGSLLSSVRLRFNGLQHEVFEKVPEKANRYRDSLRLLDEAIDELRQISHNMVPASLSRFGLGPALNTFATQVRASGELEVDLQILGLEERLPEEMEVHIYRICQELVQNVIKHARASKLRIQIIRHDDAINISVEDNGIGMIKDSVTRGFGFSTIQSNVDLFKGTFTIESQPGKGCLVLIDLPVG